MQCKGVSCQQCISLFGTYWHASFSCKDCSQALCRSCATEVMNCCLGRDREFDYLCLKCSIREKNSHFVFDYCICCFLNCTNHTELVTVEQSSNEPDKLLKEFCRKHFVGWNRMVVRLLKIKQYWLSLSTQELHLPKDISTYIALFLDAPYGMITESAPNTQYCYENDRNRCVGIKWVKDRQIVCLLRAEGYT